MYSVIFSTKNKQCICNIFIRNFKEWLTNDVVNFEQLAPVCRGKQAAIQAPNINFYQTGWMNNGLD